MLELPEFRSSASRLSPQSVLLPLQPFGSYYAKLPFLQPGKRERRSVIPACEPLIKEMPEEKSDPAVIASVGSSTPSFYVDLEIRDATVRALVDSGATKTFVGRAGLDLFANLGFHPFEVPVMRVILAAGQVEYVNYASTFTARLHGRETQSTAYWMPTLAEEIILGMEFLQAARMVIDFYGQTWHYRDDPSSTFSFVPSEVSSRVIICCGLRTLDEADADRLQQLLADELPPPSDKPGVTSLTSHHIDVGGHEPIRQKPYM